MAIGAQPGDVAALADRVVDALGEPTSFDVLREPLSGELRAWNDDLRGAPVLVVAAVALLAAAVLVHSLAVTARRRRRELAVLRALGMTGAGAASALCSQALWLTGAATVLGVPAGVLTAMIGWRYLAGNLGVAGDAAWAVAPILTLIALSLLLAVLISWAPIRRIKRDNIAEALRVE